MASEALSSDRVVSLSPEPLLQMIQGLEVTAILQAGVQLRVFDHVADGKNQPRAIAAAIGADERGTRLRGIPIGDPRDRSSPEEGSHHPAVG